MRLIDADALYQETESVVQYVEDEIEKAKQNPNGYSPKYIEGSVMQIMGMAHIQQCILDAPTVKPELQWIPCSERLPEEDKDVLVTVHFMGLKQTHPNGWNDHIKPKYYVDIASHIDGKWSSASDEYKIARSRHIVIAWMPLPEPYTERREE